MRILIVDDSDYKIASIVSVIRRLDEDIRVDSSENVVQALEYLSINAYDLMILDIVLPYRTGDKEIPETSYRLISEIQRNETYYYPNYILGLTQHEGFLELLGGIWPVIKYEQNSNDWIDKLEYIVNILKRRSRYSIVDQIDIKPTVFLEGLTDVTYLTHAIRIYRPSLLEKIDIRSDKAAGYNWVKRMIIIWAHSLYQKDVSSYYKALGVFDGDKSGKNAASELNSFVKDNSKMKSTYSVYCLSVSDAKHLMPIVKKGLLVPIEIESLFSFEHWNYAFVNNLTEPISDLEDMISDPRGWDKMNQSFKDYVKLIGLSEEELMYLNKIKFCKKKSFCDYITSIPVTDGYNVFENFIPLIEKIESILVD